jgi:hypothetical protein
MLDAAVARGIADALSWPEGSGGKDAGMPDRQKLQRDVDALLEAIQRDYSILNDVNLTDSARASIRRRIDWCTKELADLVAKLESTAPSQ